MGEDAERRGLLNRHVAPGAALAAATEPAEALMAGPTDANGVAKTLLHMERDVGVDQAL